MTYIAYSLSTGLTDIRHSSAKSPDDSSPIHTGTLDECRIAVRGYLKGVQTVAKLMQKLKND